MNRVEELRDAFTAFCKSEQYSTLPVLGKDTLGSIAYLLRVAESAILTRNMLKACIGIPVDDRYTIFLDKALEDRNGNNTGAT